MSLVSDKYITGFSPVYGLAINDRVLVNQRVGTLLALRQEKFIILPRFLIRLDPINQKNDKPESLFIEAYLSQIQLI